MRAARAAAENDLPMSEFTLSRLADAAPDLPVPWPEHIRADFVSLLGAGTAAVRVMESLDHAGLLERFIPEWRAVRSKAQHNPVHRFTVDRHLLETAAQAAELTRTVSRPDLLLVGALLHDIGKGYAGDHSDRRRGARRGDRRADGISAPQTSARSGRSSGTTCCCPTRRPGATSTTR